MNQIARISSTLPADTSPMLGIIERAARDPSVDVDKLKSLLGIQREIEGDIARKEYNAAMRRAQSEMEPIRKDLANKQTGSKYASYDALDGAARPIYTRHGIGLSFSQGDHPDPLTVRVLCDITHDSGHEKQVHADMPADGKGAKGGEVMTRTHATGSAFQYGRRYLLKMIFNLVEKSGDDDGNAAGNTHEFVTAKQAANLKTLIESTGGDVAKFCEFAKVESLTNIYAGRYDAAVSAINQAAAKRKAAK